MLPLLLIKCVCIFACLCSTKLDRSETDEFKQREVRAAKLASEIETKDKSDTVDDVGTEEEMCVAYHAWSLAVSSNYVV